MAVNFTPSGGATTTLGGTSGSGPFPNYSISCEFETSEEQTVIASKYNITIIAKIMGSGDTADRQDSMMAETNKLLAALMNQDEQTGKLEMSPTSGGGDNIDFAQATLKSVDFAQFDEATHMQYREVTYVFEARKKVTEGEPEVETLEESWDISTNDGQPAFLGADFTLDPYKTYTITHTLSATGKKDYPAGVATTSAWKEARDWVFSRLQADPIGAIISKDSAGKGMLTNFIVNDDLQAPITDYTAYNHNRVTNVSLVAGTFGLTETWFLSKSNVTHEVDVSLDQSAEGETTVTVSGTITGINTMAYNESKTDMLKQAEGALASCLSQGYTLANKLYSEQGPEGVLRNFILSKSVGRNIAGGVMTWSVSYNDLVVTIEDAISETISVTDDNENRTIKTIAIIAIIGKADGPIFQDIGTTPERKRSLSIEAVMKKAARLSKPSPENNADVEGIVAGYKPANAYEQSRNETWNAARGSYNLSLDWVY